MRPWCLRANRDYDRATMMANQIGDSTSEKERNDGRQGAPAGVYEKRWQVTEHAMNAEGQASKTLEQDGAERVVAIYVGSEAHGNKTNAGAERGLEANAEVSI